MSTDGPSALSGLSDSQLDRAEGVLLAQACGDALGVPWELGHRPADPGCGSRPGEGFMQGGGLGPYAPGEWSDDTQMAVVVARVAATGVDLTSRDALDAIANGFIDWLASAASDVGVQTRAVLTSVARHRGEPGVSERMRRAALDYHRASGGRSAGNGALMRNGVVGLTRLHDPRATAAAARAVASLTHADPLAGDSCVIQAEMIRAHVVSPAWEGRPFNGANPLAALEPLDARRRRYWHDLFDGGAYDPANRDSPGLPPTDGFTVDALGKACLAFTAANHEAGARESLPTDRTELARTWLRLILAGAVRASDDSDTVAAIAGAVAGSYLGAAAVPEEWEARIHGLPAGPDAGPLRATDLRALARRTALAGLGRPEARAAYRSQRAGSEHRARVSGPAAQADPS